MPDLITATRWALLGALGSLVVACGPSMRNLVESDMRFERCYHIDDDPHARLEDKRACWADWNNRYTKGQDRSRVQYAKERLRALDQTPTGGGPPPEGPVASAPTGPTGPAPSPYSPPPPTQPKEIDAANGSSSPPVWQTCGNGCTKTWKGCAAPCAGLVGCVAECDAHFKTCMKACF